MRVARVRVIASLFLRRQLRSADAMVMAFVVPLLIALVWGYADQRAHDALAVGVVHAEGAPLADDLVAALRAEPALRVRSFGDGVALEDAVVHGEVFAGVIVPDDYDRRAVGGADLGVRIFGRQDESAFVAARAAVTLVVDRERQVLDTARELAAARTAERTAPLATLVDEMRERTTARPVDVDSQITARSLRATGIGRATAGMLLYVMFHMGLYQSSLLVSDRHHGALTRVAVTATRDGEHLVGELAGRLAFLGLQAGGVVFVATLLFDIRWGAPAGVVAAITLFTIVTAAVGIVVGCRRRASIDDPTFARVGAAALLGILGGCFFSLELVPAWLRSAAHVTPHAWAMDVLETLIATNAGVDSVARPLLVLAGFAAVTSVYAVRRMRRVAYA